MDSIALEFELDAFAGDMTKKIPHIGSVLDARFIRGFVG
jgi:hypothetical protein